MRGKGTCTCRCYSRRGITPAYAGKSPCRKSAKPAGGDHPRVCGEKHAALLVHRPVWGSPPRMRGKVRKSAESGKQPGITPAYAGKRFSDLRCFCVPWDHPRVCGEKSLWQDSQLFIIGSPPRMRGKGAQGLITLPLRGITPAYAGKSIAPVNQIIDALDHPRVCGEKPVRCTLA